MVFFFGHFRLRPISTGVALATALMFGVGIAAPVSAIASAAVLKSLTSGTVSRLAGQDRFATSAAISAASFSPGVPVVYIANGYNFPDALSGAPVAGKNRAPVLLLPSDGVPSVTRAELTRLKPGRIVVLGGTGAISNNSLTALESLTTGAVSRLAGQDRFATSAAISAASFSPGVPVAYIANGYNFPDALSGAPVAGKNNAPVLLSPAGGIPTVIQAELTRLKPGRIVVLGGTSAISDTSVTTFSTLTSGTVSRLAGQDRFATSAAISAASFGPGVPVVYIANGYNFPDALSGAPVAGKNRAPVLLVPGDVVPAVTRAELTRLKPGRIVVLGGTGAVSNNSVTALTAYTASPVAPAKLIFTVTPVPTVSGTRRVGSVLTAVPGTWNPSPGSLQYQWLSGGNLISGATASTLNLSSALAGGAISVSVTASRSGYPSVTKTSTSTGAILGATQLNPGEELRSGQYLQSPNAQYKLVMQSDGNLVEYDSAGSALWSTGTSGSNFVAMQTDGNLVVYGTAGGAAWSTFTNLGSTAVLALQDDSSLVLYQGSTPLWSRSVKGFGTVKAPGGTQGMSAPTLASTQQATYPADRVLGLICYSYGQTVTGQFGRGNLWHQVPDGNYVPDVDLLTGANGPVPGEPQCGSSGSNNSSLDQFVAKYNGQAGVPNVAGTFPGQCVSLISQYLQQDFGITSGAWGNAVDYQAGGSGGNQLQSRGFTWYADQGFQNGDILVWGESASSGTGAAGHIGIWYNGRIFDQNDGRGTRTIDPGSGTYSVGYANFFAGGFIGYWRHG